MWTCICIVAFLYLSTVPIVFFNCISQLHFLTVFSNYISFLNPHCRTLNQRLCIAGYPQEHLTQVDLREEWALAEARKGDFWINQTQCQKSEDYQLRMKPQATKETFSNHIVYCLPSQIFLSLDLWQVSIWNQLFKHNLLTPHLVIHPILPIQNYNSENNCVMNMPLIWYDNILKQ